MRPEAQMRSAKTTLDSVVRLLGIALYAKMVRLQSLPAIDPLVVEGWLNFPLAKELGVLGAKYINIANTKAGDVCRVMNTEGAPKGVYYMTPCQDALDDYEFTTSYPGGVGTNNMVCAASGAHGYHDLLLATLLLITAHDPRIHRGYVSVAHPTLRSFNRATKLQESGPAVADPSTGFMSAWSYGVGNAVRRVDEFFPREELELEYPTITLHYHVENAEKSRRYEDTFDKIFLRNPHRTQLFRNSSGIWVPGEHDRYVHAFGSRKIIFGASFLTP